MYEPVAELYAPGSSGKPGKYPGSAAADEPFDISGRDVWNHGLPYTKNLVPDHGYIDQNQTG